MLSEDQKNLNCLRGILYACEEGANEAPSERTDELETWTEQDRRNSRRTADWIRSMVLADVDAERSAAAAANKKPAPKSEQLFSEERLWIELDKPDGERRQSAVVAMDALCDLAQLRARALGTSFLQERRTIFDLRLLRADLKMRVGAHFEAAFRVWQELCHLVALCDAEDIPSTEEERRWITEAVAKIQAKVAAWLAAHDAAVGAEREGGNAE